MIGFLSLNCLIPDFTRIPGFGATMYVGFDYHKQSIMFEKV